MKGNYTKEANSRCYNVADEDIYRIWDTIESLSDEETAECWKEKITDLAYEYSFSSRFALMRIIRNRINDPDTGVAALEGCFEVDTGEGLLVFTEPSIEYAKNMPEEEIKQYEALLWEMASLQEDADEIADRYLIAKAMRDFDEAENIAVSNSPGDNRDSISRAKKESRTLLTRSEALALGHILGFSLEEMSWFLLRVFDFEDSFRYNASEDLIEAFTFLTGGNRTKAKMLKKEYLEKSSGISKGTADNRRIDWTQNVGESLPELVCKWNMFPDTLDRAFMEWLLMQSPELDLPSRTASDIYRQLSVYVYEISEELISVPSVEEYREEISRICNGESEYREMVGEYLFDGGKASVKKCRKLSGDILEKNKNLYTSAPDRSKAWRTVTSDDKGLPRLIMAGRPDAERSRVQDLLEGSRQLEKGDMLHMLWYGFNLCWEEKPITDSMEDLQWNLADFTEASEEILDAALLPPFYPPHIMEQSMMLSIVVSIEDDGIPASNYALLCESLIKPRNRNKDKHKE